jgi:hypothetical protein
MIRDNPYGPVTAHDVALAVGEVMWADGAFDGHQCCTQDQAKTRATLESILNAYIDQRIATGKE